MKNVVMFPDSTVKRLKMKQFNSHIHGSKVYLKAFPGAKADQLNQHVKPSYDEYDYDAEIIHIRINDILRSKEEKEVNDIPREIMNIAEARQNDNITKIFISLLIRSSRTTIDIDFING